MQFLKAIAGGLVALTIASPVWASGPFDGLYVFGDSLSDAGNLLAEVGFPAGPPVEPYYEGRFADGPVYSDILASVLGLELEASAYGGTNFADGGARTNYHRLEIDSTKPSPVDLLGPVGYSAGMDLGGIGYGSDARCTGPFTTDPALVSSGVCIGYLEDYFPWTLDGQVGAFHDLRVAEPFEPYADGLYVVFAGANDLSDLITATAVFCAVDPDDPLRDLCPDESVQGAFISRIVGGIQRAIEELVDAGAHYILFLNVPDLGLIPELRFSPLSTPASALASATNTALGAMLAGLEAGWATEGKYINLMPYDSFAFLGRVVNNPGDFGFTNAVDPCYSGFVNDPVEFSLDELAAVCPHHVFFDKEHPTSALHEVLAQDMLEFMRTDMLDYLDDGVRNLDVRSRIKRALQRSLANAREVLTDDRPDNDAVAVLYLRAFIAKIRLHTRAIAGDDADALTDAAEKLISIIGAILRA